MTWNLSRRIPPKNWRHQSLHLYCCFLLFKPFLATFGDLQKKHFFNHMSNNLCKYIKIDALQRFYPTFCRLSRVFFLDLDKKARNLAESRLKIVEGSKIGVRAWHPGYFLCRFRTTSNVNGYSEQITPIPLANCLCVVPFPSRESFNSSISVSFFI